MDCPKSSKDRNARPRSDARLRLKPMMAEVCSLAHERNEDGGNEECVPEVGEADH